MRKLLGVGFTVLVNAMFIGALAWSSLPPLPKGEISIADVSDGQPIVVTSSER